MPGFTLSLYPWTYNANYKKGDWEEHYVEKAHRSPAEEASADEATRSALLRERNSFPEMPFINYSSQYGLGCFEGLKAFPQKDGRLMIFRPDLNAQRFRESMEGLKMPAFPEGHFLKAVKEVVLRNSRLGFKPDYDAAWEKNNFLSAQSVYIRPFTWAEGGIGLNLSYAPSVVIITTPVGSYFDPDARSKAITTEMVRATDKGTGWIKCIANYVIPILAKKQAIADGYMEAIFLDYREQRYIEEGSSCNIFFLLKNGSLVTPALEERVLNGVNRRSIMQLAGDMGVRVEERRINIEEALSETQECFVTGTAAGLNFIESITHKGKTASFNKGKPGALSQELLYTLKGIQYGAIEDRYGWMFAISS